MPGGICALNVDPEFAPAARCSLLSLRVFGFRREIAIGGQRAYFDTIRKARTAVKIPPQFDSPQQPVTVGLEAHPVGQPGERVVDEIAGAALPHDPQLLGGRRVVQRRGEGVGVRGEHELVTGAHPVRRAQPSPRPTR